MRGEHAEEGEAAGGVEAGEAAGGGAEAPDGPPGTANGAALSDDPVRFADDRLRFFAGEG
ncbi:hypothetical protein GCM10017602_15790 [Herbiconiux flava]|nr:hypothetical protein GCM10017602_15790 [Herbiconiux flava]